MRWRFLKVSFQDFYEFACGGFEERVVIPDDRSSRSQFAIIGKATYRIDFLAFHSTFHHLLVPPLNSRHLPSPPAPPNTP